MPIVAAVAVVLPRLQTLKPGTPATSHAALTVMSTPGQMSGDQRLPASSQRGSSVGVESQFATHSPLPPFRRMSQ